jgi:alkyl hydroperoxide reductase subunit D
MSQNAEAVEPLFAGRDGAAVRDLKLNLKKLLGDASLDGREAGLTLVAVAATINDAALAAAARAFAESVGLPENERVEARELAALMTMLNRYYRFRHMLEEAHGAEHLANHYRGAGLRMNALSKPALGRELTELIALAVSVVNGCQSCIAAHEAELRKAGVDVAKTHDAVRLASVASGVGVLGAPT